MVTRADADGFRVGIAEPSGRVEKMSEPLAAVGIDLDIDPDRLDDVDVLVFDKPSRELFEAAISRVFRSPKVVYRMRGDCYSEYVTEGIPYPKRWLANEVLFRAVDGAVAITQSYADLLAARSGVHPTGVAGLAIDVGDWPRVDHEDDDLRLVTLTNANYRRKIQPIVDSAPLVDDVLGEGDVWRVCGAGKYEHVLREGLASCERVSFEGFVDARAVLAESNAMVHLSELDGLPNSILEGLASGLPVITNDFTAFVEFGWPLVVTNGGHELVEALAVARDPAWRRATGRAGRRYVAEHHTAEAVGQQYLDFFARVVDGA